jgi:hypothetical protein
MTGVYSSDIDEDELPELLADGIYVDNDNDEFDYTQKIQLYPTQLTMFEDNDYAEDEPTIGFRIANGVNVLNYTLTMTDQPLIEDLATSDLMIMGKSYYVLSNSSSGINKILTLLDSAEEAILNEGSTATVAGHSVSIAYISNTEVKLTVDGVTTNSLSETNTQKLADGSYLGIKDILYNSKEGTVSSVEFSIGTGKLKLTSGSDVEINDDVVNELGATITNNSDGDKLASIMIQWDADDDLFITTDRSETMPGFGAVKLSYGGLTYPTTETLTVEKGGSLYIELSNFPLKDTTADIPFLYGDSAGNFSGIGKDSTNKLVTSAVGSAVTFDSDTDDYFPASWNSTAEAESYLVRATNFITENSVDKVDFQYLKDGSWTTFKTKAQHDDTFSLGSIDFRVFNPSNANNNVVVNTTASAAAVNFNTIYSKEGMRVQLPYQTANTSTAEGAVNFTFGAEAAATGHNSLGFYLVMREEDKDDNMGTPNGAGGDWINLTIGWDSGSTAQPQVNAVGTSATDATSTEIGDTDVFRDFTYSALATEILYEQPSSGQKSVKLMYHGSEVKADVYVADVGTVIGGGGALGDVLVTDSEVSSVSSKNLIVVGGSCINSAAASLVGGTYCTSAWTTATGVGAGQFILKGYSSSSITTRMALLVAGYEAADTTNAATYLRTQSVDTSKTYKGTSATQATLVVS